MRAIILILISCSLFGQQRLLDPGKNTLPANKFGYVIQYIDGTLSSTANEFVDKSGNGFNLDIINRDFNGKGLPYKSAALVAQKAANYGKIPDPTNFWFTAGVPNQIPVVSFFQNVDYANTTFTRHQAQLLNPDSTEYQEPAVMEIVTYSTALSGNNLTLANAYFNVPAIDATAKWVDGINGNDGTGTGSQAAPWKTLQKANATASTGLKIYVLSSAYTESISPGATYMYMQTAHAWQGLGLVTWKNISGTRVALLVGTTVKSFTGIVFDGSNSSAANIEVFSGSTNNNFERCKFINTATYNYVQSGSSVVGFNNCVFDIGSKAAIFRPDSYLKVTNSVFTGTLSNSIDDASSTSYSNYLFCKFNVSCPGIALLKPGISSAKYVWNYNTFNISGANPKLASSQNSLYTSVKFNYNNIASTSFSTNIMFQAVGVGATYTIQNNKVLLQNSTLANSVFDVREAASLNISYNSITTLSDNDCPHIFINNGSGNTTTVAIVNYNTLISNSSPGHVLQVGSESTGSGDNKINGGQCVGNKIYGKRYFDNMAAPTIHGLFIGFQKNWTISQNYVNGTGINIIVKGTSTTTWTTGVVSYNISVNGKLNNFYSKGISGVNFYNNTSYNDLSPGSSMYHFEFSINSGSDGASNCQVKNNIIIDRSANVLSKLISADDALSTSSLTCNNNILYSKSGIYGYTFASTNNNFAQWQALGYDANSLNTNLSFISVANENFIPFTYVACGANLGAPYDYGFDILTNFYPKSTAFINSVLKQQSGSAWQNGAIVK